MDLPDICKGVCAWCIYSDWCRDHLLSCVHVCYPGITSDMYTGIHVYIVDTIAVTKYERQCIYAK